MIFVAFTKSSLRSLPVLIFILVLGLALRLLKINEAFPFDHDQEIVANSAYNFFIDHKLTLIGQELSFPGFFLGPLHNWITLLPYGLCKLSPACVPYFFVTIGILTIILTFFFLKNILGTRAAFLVCLIYAISATVIRSEIGASSNFFLYLSSLGLFIALYKYFQEKNIALPIGAFIAGLATVNFNPVFLFTAIAFFATSLLRKNKKFYIYLLSASVFAVNYLPLFIFNFRHQNILWQNAQNFFSQNSAPSSFLPRLQYLAAEVALPYYSDFFFKSTSLVFTLSTIAIIVFGFISLKEYFFKNKFFYLLPIWIVATLFGFSFYGGNIPDYYFMQTWLPLTILAAMTLTKNLHLFIAFIALFAFTNVNSLQNFSSNINFKIKKSTVSYVVTDTNQESFNVYYDFPPGLNTGYNYLFKIKGAQPVEGGRNLYILDFKDPSKFDLVNYYYSFPKKKIALKSIGFVNIVSVK